MRTESTSNFDEWSDAMKRYAYEAGISIAEALRFQSRLLGQRLIDFTPPQGGRMQGINAVRRDIRRAIEPLYPTFDDQNINNMVLSGDTVGLRIVLPRIAERYRRGLFVRFDPKFHQDARSKYVNRNVGRGWAKAHPTFTPDYGAWGNYVKEISKRVGMARGGWAFGVIKLGGRASNYIAQHAVAAFGSLTEQLRGQDKYVEFRNSSPWARRHDPDRIIRKALSTRARDIETSIADLIAKQWKGAR